MRMELTMTRTRIAVSLLAGLWLACSTERAFTKGEYSDPNEIDLLSEGTMPTNWLPFGPIDDVDDLPQKRCDRCETDLAEDAAGRSGRLGRQGRRTRSR